MKQALTFTIVAGSRKCLNNCKICISKMTPTQDIGLDLPVIDWKCFERAVNIAINYRSGTVLITGKGEPTLFPRQITRFLIKLRQIEKERNYQFNKYELQTSGSPIAFGICDDFLDIWQDLGLDVVAISIYHYHDDKNKEIFQPVDGQWFSLTALTHRLQSMGFKIRLSCILLNGYIDSITEIQKLISFAKQHNIFQLTLRRADRPAHPLNETVAKFVDDNRLTDKEFSDISDFLRERGTVCDVLPHGAIVYEIDHQNVCITTGLSDNSRKEEIRHLIFFPPDKLTTSWENVMGARIL